MNKIEFQVKFITPLLIHGANSRKLDEIGLTGKALRGCWRFWFRAIVGGLVNNLRPEELYKKECEIFGSPVEKSSDEKVGVRFKLLVEPVNNLETSITSIKFRSKEKPISFEGYKIGTIFKITIIPKEDYSEIQKKVLWATIWTWANLGAIGQRARRGFGSVVITNSKVKFPNGLQIKENFANSPELKRYLTNGFEKVQDIFINWLGSGNAQKKLDVPQDARYFILQSPNQIKVANNSFKDLATALNKVHGSSRCDCLGWAKEKSRMASPVFTRFHIVNKQYLPVITFCHQRVNRLPGYNVFEQCLNAYMYGVSCPHGVSFPNIGFVNNP